MAYKKTSTYVARPVDANGNAAYTDEENQIWHELITRQIPIVQGRACDEYMRGVELLNLPHDRIPQCHEVSSVLRDITGWALEPVPALIPFDRFFNLLANRKFPAATFIRTREELNYLQEPDIFHEVFGHCPLLTNQAYADFTHTYGKLGLKASPQDRVMLAKLYWFTIEFGLIQTAAGMRIYGGGILSSMGETPYALESSVPQRKAFDVLEVLRTPYRIDIMQPIYYVIDSFDVLFHLIDMDLIDLIHQARQLGMYEPVYATDSQP
ncbi:phenylalanine 4-monooxygenase [Aquicella lusitana]|uniref:Phenylalanine-4-hydroxylase n=1 Tax=Aquicella lusitana TaxID=254246 RepID=A0A370GKK7_9COXI|nr:phenylalanine 4-monooxygenase [Aquicella lusitana]RDI43809.1 phenylalanine 4-hydroxylase [Aquicella lusitana]VVC74460.1 Phenylalanine-4-hydroxylase [Aquicella lusitana]